MSSSANPPLPPSSSDHDQHMQHRQRAPMSFRSSVGSMPSPFRTVDGVAGPSTARADLLMRSALGSGGIAAGISTSGYYADVSGTLGSSWISRLRRPSPQPPPSYPAEAVPSAAAADQSAGTEGSGVAGASGAPRPAAQPSHPRPEAAPYLNSAYHVQRLCLSPLGREDNLLRGTQQPSRQVPAKSRVKGFGPFWFNDVQDEQSGCGIRGSRPAMRPGRSPPHLQPLPLASHSQQPQLQLPPRTTPVPNPWNLATDDAEVGCLKSRPSGFFPLFAKIVRVGEEAQGAPKTATPSAAEVGDLEPLVLQQRQFRVSGAEKDTISERVTSHHSGESRTRGIPLLPHSSAGGSTVRLASGGTASRPTYLSRPSYERLMDLNPASPSQSLTDAVFPAGGDRCKSFPAFGLSLRPIAAAGNACLPADPWRDISVLPGNPKDDSQGCQFFYKDATGMATSRNLNLLVSSSNPSRLAPPCRSEDRLSFWNMGRFWPTGASSEYLSRKRLLQAPAASVASPLKCRKLGNQG